MNYYYGYASGLGVLAGISTILCIVLFVLAVVAYFLTIGCLVHSAQTKGHHLNGAGKLWFIGIFGTPILLALYVISLPDHSVTQPTPDAQAGYPQFPQGYDN